MSTPEQQARAEIDRLLQAAGWVVQSVDAVGMLPVLCVQAFDQAPPAAAAVATLFS